MTRLQKTVPLAFLTISGILCAQETATLPQNQPPITAEPAPSAEPVVEPSHGSSEKLVSANVLRAFQLEHARSEDILPIVSRLFGSPTDHIADDSRTNRILVRADELTLKEIGTLIQILDRPVAKQPTRKRNLSADDEPRLEERREKFGPEAARGRVGEGIGDDSVESLRAAYQAAEKEVKDHAEQVRGDLSTAVDPEQHEDAFRQQLRPGVQRAFRARQKLQRAELAEFARRLKRIQQSIETRDRIADKVIDRRVEELLDPNLQWDSAEPTQTTTSPELATNISARPLRPHANVAPQSADAARPGNATPTIRSPDFAIQIKCERDCLFESFGQQGWHSVGRDAVTSMRLRLGENRTIRVSDVPGDHRLIVTAEIQTTNPALEQSIWTRLPRLDLLLTDEDIEMLRKGSTVKKVAYLHDGNRIGQVDSTRLAADLDPVAEARQYGTVIAVATFTGARDEVTPIRSVHELSGTWSVISVRRVTGDAISRRDPRHANGRFLEIGTDRWTTYSTEGGMTEWSATFNLDESPQTLVLRASDELGHEFMYRGLIEWSDGTLQTATFFSQRSAPNAPSAFDDPGVMVTTYRRGGEVTSRDDDGRVEISLGINDGVRLGQQLRVSSDQTPVGTIEVIYVEEESASARILEEADERSIQTGDRVEIIPPATDVEPEEATSRISEGRTKFDTPRALLDSMHAAGKRKDYAAFVSVLTDDEAKRLAGMMMQSATMVSGLSQIAAQAGADAGNGPDAAALANIAEVMERHARPDAPEVASAVFQQLSERMFTIAFDPKSDPAPSAEEYSALLKQSAGMLKDPRAFAAEILKAMEQLGGEPVTGAADDGDPAWDIVINGDHAVATDTREQKPDGGGSLASPKVELQLIGGRWKVSKLYSDDVITTFAAGPQEAIGRPVDVPAP